MTILRTALVVLMMTGVGLATQTPAVSGADAWIAEPAAGATTALAYVTINNPTMYEVYVMSASSTAAEKIEMRQGSAAAEKVVSNIAVPAYGSAELKAGDGHLALVGLKRPLKAGESVDLTLVTDGGVKLALTAVVKTP